jgi:WD40 domain-containing protein
LQIALTELHLILHLTATAEPMRHDREVYSAQFSADGQWVVTASEDQTARVWDAASGKATAEPMRHDGGVYSAQFSADGQRVVTASGDHTARVWDAASCKAIGEPMRHEDAVYSAQFSADGQRVVTASGDTTARVWDAPAIRNEDTPDDVLLLADLAEAACGSALQTSGRSEILIFLPPDQVRATREKIAAKFERQTSGLTPVERLLKWSVADPRRRTISPFSKLTVPEWIEHRIKEGTFESLRAAIQMDSANARLIAHFGLALANLAAAGKTDRDEARRARAEADYQTHRAVKLASGSGLRRKRFNTGSPFSIRKYSLAGKLSLARLAAASNCPRSRLYRTDYMPKGFLSSVSGLAPSFLCSPRRRRPIRERANPSGRGRMCGSVE